MSSKARFSEVMWFKHGEQDELQPPAGQHDDAVAPRANHLPIEDRYHDDGTLTGGDLARYSLRTGATAPLPIMRAATATAGSAAVSDRELIGEMRHVNLWLIAVVVVAVVSVVAGVLA
jgi:hypothetical protein